MWSRTVLFVLAALAGGCSRAQDQLHVGCGINVFSRYGYMSISMRVVPRNDSDPTWIFREPTVDVFKNLVPIQRQKSALATNAPVFDGDFHMEFCDNLKQLLQAYFRDFSFERLDRPWRAFSGSWSKAVIARHFGINASYVSGQHCYVLVRVARHRDSAQLGVLGDDVVLEDAVQKEVHAVKTGDAPSVVQFIKSFGSHYIASYVTGNSLYQVFVYAPPIYAKIKERLKSRSINDISPTELSNYFSPWSADHIGSIQAASGNATVTAWAASQLRISFHVFAYASLLKLHGNVSLLKKLDRLLGNEALLQIDLRVLQAVFKEPAKRQWFLEVLDNYLKLWESNM